MFTYGKYACVCACSYGGVCLRPSRTNDVCRGLVGVWRRRGFETGGCAVIPGWTGGSFAGRAGRNDRVARPP